MTNEEFDKVLLRALSHADTVLNIKKGEYASGEDRLHNFKRAAALQGCTPEKALLGMQAKHTVSIEDMVNDLAKGIVPKEARIWEKIGDRINYDILLLALLMERITPVKFRILIESRELSEQEKETAAYWAGQNMGRGSVSPKAKGSHGSSRKK